MGFSDICLEKSEIEHFRLNISKYRSNLARILAIFSLQAIFSKSIYTLIPLAQNFRLGQFLDMLYLGGIEKKFKNTFLIF